MSDASFSIYPAGSTCLELTIELLDQEVKYV